MSPLRPLILLIALSTALAGCTQPRESSDGDDARSFRVEVPADATHVRVDATAQALAGQPDVTVLIETPEGTNLDSATFDVVGNTTRSLTVGVDGPSTLIVRVRVVDGEASLDVTATALVPGQVEVVIVREVIVVAAPAPSPGPSPTPTPEPTSQATPTPSPTPEPTPTPTPTATPSPTPPPTNETNTTSNETNTTG